MSRTLFTTIAVVGALALPATAGAEIAVFSEAKRERLHVVSSILLVRGSVDMMGGWFNNSISCAAERRLRVSVQIFRSRGNSTDVFRASKRQRVANCAEGGPNVGFNVTAAEAGFACSDGRWRPGRYEFVTRTRHRASGVVSVAVLGWTKQRAC
jgi:hypothetical protein